MSVKFISVPCEIALRAALNSKGLRYVGTRGNTKSPICIVGEAPGRDEYREGYPFIGASGWLLDSMLKEIGIDSNTCWFTNIYKARPPENDIKRIDELGIPSNLFINQ